LLIVLSSQSRRLKIIDADALYPGLENCFEKAVFKRFFLNSKFQMLSFFICWATYFIIQINI